MQSTRSGRRTSCEMLTLPSARLQDLDALLNFLHAFCAQSEIGDEDRFALMLAIEEVVTNIMLHGYGQNTPGPIEVTLCTNGKAVQVTIVDRAAPFDPLEAPRPQLDVPAELRSVGGLGWHLVRELMSEIRYDYDPSVGNTVHLTRPLAA